MGLLTKRTSFCALALCAAILTFHPAPAVAQSAAAGTVSGQITDPSGAAIGGAEVRLIDNATSTIKTVVTNDSGRYDFFNVPPAVYDVNATKPGFSEARFTKTNGTSWHCAYA